jgi:enamine deaminase RidA (YjgF/YER057c/UK114 family)
VAKTRPINPWKWQDQFGFSQAIDVTQAQRVVYVAGQASVDGDGNPMHKGDFAKQIMLAIDNLETVLKQSGMSLANVVRLSYYTTDIQGFMNAAPVFGPRLGAARCTPASTLLGITTLFHPDLKIEIEATAVE